MWCCQGVGVVLGSRPRQRCHQESSFALFSCFTAPCGDRESSQLPADWKIKESPHRLTPLELLPQLEFPGLGTVMLLMGDGLGSHGDPWASPWCACEWTHALSREQLGLGLCGC